jgi:Sec-independent protein translocase protein TatA
MLTLACVTTILIFDAPPETMHHRAHDWFAFFFITGWATISLLRGITPTGLANGPLAINNLGLPFSINALFWFTRLCVVFLIFGALRLTTLAYVTALFIFFEAGHPIGAIHHALGAPRVFFITGWATISLLRGITHTGVAKGSLAINNLGLPFSVNALFWFTRLCVVFLIFGALKLTTLAYVTALLIFFEAGHPIGAIHHALGAPRVVIIACASLTTISVHFLSILAKHHALNVWARKWFLV